MGLLIKNKVLFLSLFFAVLFLFNANSVFAADPTGCCRFDQYDNILYGWEPKARTTTKAGCEALNNLKGDPKTDALGFYLNRIPKNEGGYAWCEKQPPDVDYDGCCYWEEQNRLGGVPQPYAKEMKQSECEGRKGYETADKDGNSSVAWYLGGTVDSIQKLPACVAKKAPTSPQGGGGGGNSSNQTSPMGGGGAPSISGTFAGLDNPLGTDSIPALIGRVIRALLGIIGSLALIMFVAGGLMWMTSMGSEKRVAAGKSTLIWAAVGLVVVFFSYVIVKFVLETVTTP